MAETDDRGFADLVNDIGDEAVGKVVRFLINTDFGVHQTEARSILVRLFRRNAIFTARVGSKNRLTIPESEVEKLDLEQGDMVQVGLTPLEIRPEDQGKSSQTEQDPP